MRVCVCAGDWKFDLKHGQGVYLWGPGQSKQASGSVGDIMQDHVGLGCCSVMFGAKFGGDSASENNE